MRTHLMPMALIGLMTVFLAVPADARILSVKPIDGAPGKIIAAPPMVLDEAIASSAHMIGFDEKQNVLLTRDLPVDGGTIEKGTWVDSHMILFNLPDLGIGDSDDFLGGLDDSGEWFFGVQAENEWVFSGPVLGVMSDIDGQLEQQSTALLGNPKTTYPVGGLFLRGLEESDFYDGVATSRLRVRMSVWQPGDWIRVITGAQPIADSRPELKKPQLSENRGRRQ